MKNILIITMLILSIGLFADSGYRYSVDITGTGTDVNYSETWQTVSNAAQNIFDDAEVTIEPTYNADGSIDLKCKVSGVLPVSKQTDVLEFSGLGEVGITMLEATVPLVAQDSLGVRLQEWVNQYRAVLANNGILASANNNSITFESYIAGFSYTSPTVSNTSGDLEADVTTTAATLPDVSNMDMLIYQYFNSIINITDFETHSNRDFHQWEQEVI